MCEPTIIAAGLSLAGTGVGIAGQVQASEEEARVAQANEARARTEASLIRNRTGIEASRVLSQGRDVKGSAIAAAGGSGLAVSGFENIFAASDINAQQDADLLRAQGEERAQGRDFEADEIGRQGRARKRAGLLSSIGTGVSGFGSAAAGFIRTLPSK